jgi:hypothetical protein
VLAKIEAANVACPPLSTPIQETGHNLTITKLQHPEIAALLCATIYRGRLPAPLEPFIPSHAKWILVSGTLQADRSSPAGPMKDFYGTAGLRALSNFCRENLQVLSGDMTGWVGRQNCGFAFGRLLLQCRAEKDPVETSFVAKLLWSGFQIFLGEIRIMWPFSPGEYEEPARDPSAMAAELTALPE